MPVRIVTDSSSDLPADLAQELGITVIDLHMIDEDKQLSTSGLSSLELAAAYARQLERGHDDGVVALHLSKELSSTWSAAMTAAAIFDGAVRVIDTNSVGMAVGAAAMAAAKLAQQGASLDECEQIACDTLERSATWIYVHRLDEIRRSGRISAASALVSTALAVKPIMMVTDGKLEIVAKARTQSKAFLKLVDMITAHVHGQPAFVALQQFEAIEATQKLETMLKQALPEGSTFLITELESSLAIHGGPGAIGISVVPAAEM